MIIVPIGFLVWLIGGWSIMLLTGMIHHEIVQTVTPISYGVSLQFSLVIVIFTLIGQVVGMISASLME